MPNIENIITAKEFSLQDILSNKKYSVDFFQREYSWEKENMVQLVYDLTNGFYENYHTGDTPESIDNYNSYYMGPIVLFDQNGKSSIIDGQQRITSLTLLLIYLKHKAEKIMDDFPNGMIFSSSRGKKSFNIDIPERTKCLESLFNDNGYEPKEDDEEGITSLMHDTFTPLSAFSFMAFTLLYTPCFAAIGAIKQETNSYRWALTMCAITLVTAYIVSFLIFQIGGLAGFG